MDFELDPRLKDKEWRVNHLYKIVNKKKELVVFKRNVMQRFIAANRWFRNIYLKARQLGVTTDACIDGLDDVLFNNDFTMVIIAQDQEAVKKIFKKVKLAWDEMDEELVKFMGWQVVGDSATELAFTHGSSIRVALSSRSDTVNRLHISEFGKICAKYPLKAIEIITGAIPSVPEDGRIDIESTAEGEFGQFHDMFWEAWHRGGAKAKEQFKAFFFPWWKEPAYKIDDLDEAIPQDLKDYRQELRAQGIDITDAQLNWYYIKRQTLKDKMKQEYPSTPEEAFQGSGNKLFDWEILKTYKLLEGDVVGDWEYFERYNPRHRYAIGADVAEGVGQDSSTAVVIDFFYEKPKVVATFSSNNIAPDTFGYELEKISRTYGNCLIAVERNNHGHTTVTKLKELGANQYYQESEDREQKVAEQKGGKKPIILRRKLVKYGWSTTAASKPRMMYDLNSAIEDRLLELNSQRLVYDLRTYDKEDLTAIRFDDDQTKHWDLVIALAICWQMRTKLIQPRSNTSRSYQLNQASFN